VQAVKGVPDWRHSEVTPVGNFGIAGGSQQRIESSMTFTIGQNPNLARGGTSNRPSSPVRCGGISDFHFPTVTSIDRA
jgi:hypothetical protein